MEKTFEELLKTLKEKIIENLEKVAKTYDLPTKHIEFSKEPDLLRMFVTYFEYDKEALKKEIKELKSNLEDRFYNALNKKDVEELRILAQNNGIKNVTSTTTKEYIIKHIMIDVGTRFNEKIRESQAQVTNTIKNILEQKDIIDLKKIADFQEVKYTEKTSRDDLIEKLIEDFTNNMNERIRLRKSRLEKLKKENK